MIRISEPRTRILIKDGFRDLPGSEVLRHLLYVSHLSIIHQCEGAHSPKVERFFYNYYTDKFAKKAKKQLSIVYTFTEEMSAMMSGRSAATMTEKFAATMSEKFVATVAAK